MNNDETFEFENRVYVNPDISRDEQTAFVDTLRDLQAQKNAQIATETHNLGTDVEPHLGGLSGSEEYWQSKYQTPQVNAMVADMKAVAQQSALNTALQNYQNSLQERYNQAYRNYQKRAYNYNRKNSGGGNGGNNVSGDITQTDTTIKIDKVTPDAIMQNIYRRVFQESIEKGMSVEDAEAAARKAIGGGD